MTKDVSVLIKAINLASYDDVKSLDVSIEDLMLLRHRILEDANKIVRLNDLNREQLREIERLNNKVLSNVLNEVINTPKKLDTYI